MSFDMAFILSFSFPLNGLYVLYKICFCRDNDMDISFSETSPLPYPGMVVTVVLAPYKGYVCLISWSHLYFQEIFVACLRSVRSDVRFHFAPDLNLSWARGLCCRQMTPQDSYSNNDTLRGRERFSSECR